MRGVRKLLELSSFTNLQVNTGDEQKKVFLYLKGIIASNFELFCRVDLIFVKINVAHRSFFPRSGL